MAAKDLSPGVRSAHRQRAQPQQERAGGEADRGREAHSTLLPTRERARHARSALIGDLLTRLARAGHQTVVQAALLATICPENRRGT